MVLLDLAKALDVPQSSHLRDVRLDSNALLESYLLSIDIMLGGLAVGVFSRTGAFFG